MTRDVQRWIDSIESTPPADFNFQDTPSHADNAAPYDEDNLPCAKRVRFETSDYATEGFEVAYNMAGTPPPTSLPDPFVTSERKRPRDDTEMEPDGK